MSDFDDDYDDIPDDLDFDPDAPVIGIDPDEYEGDELSPEQVAEYEAAREAKRFEPKDFKLKQSKKRICVLDTETDPFYFGDIPRPFCLGFDMGDCYYDFWGDDCVSQFFDFLATITEPLIIYAHNGGKFDFHFLLDYVDSDQNPFIMNGRLVKLFFKGQEFRDSYTIIPQALSSYKKDEIDYQLFKRAVREKHKQKILDYMRSDCRYTLELISGFHELFGDKLTVASAALPMLHSLHGFERFHSEAMDERFRKYYFGGRNQCFETGVLKPKLGGKFILVDRNSMYPAEMRDAEHPISNRCELQTEIDERTDFACIDAWNDGALPLRTDDGGLDFTAKFGTFHATIHEIKAGLDTGTLRIKKVRHAWAFDRKASMGTFVDQFYGLRNEAKRLGDDVRNVLYKLILNSAYGKFALNPRKFRQWAFTIDELPEPLATPDKPDGWRRDGCSGSVMIWSRPAPRRTGFYNVATAASITGAARANLWRNICQSKRPIYCDTDSIICEGYNGTMGNELGQWKLEAEGDTVAIAGKKLYTMFDSCSPEWRDLGQAIKKASKGVQLSAHEILAVARGQTIEYKNPVPTFALGRTLDEMDGSDFVVRRINKTGNI
jgi:hypothetical protein